MSDSQSIISANNLRDGLNVYFIEDEAGGHWDTDMTRASVYDRDSLEPAFARAQQDMAANIVVDCIPVAVDDNHRPLTMREKIRSQGPSTKYGHQL